MAAGENTDWHCGIHHSLPLQQQQVNGTKTTFSNKAQLPSVSRPVSAEDETNRHLGRASLNGRQMEATHDPRPSCVSTLCDSHCYVASECFLFRYREITSQAHYCWILPRQCLIPLCKGSRSASKLSWTRAAQNFQPVGLLLRYLSEVARPQHREARAAFCATPAVTATARRPKRLGSTHAMTCTVPVSRGKWALLSGVVA